MSVERDILALSKRIMTVVKKYGFPSDTTKSERADIALTALALVVTAIDIHDIKEEAKKENQ